MRVVHSIDIALAALWVMSGFASPQVLYGSLVGIVTDPQHAAVVGAVITIKNRATGYSSESKSNNRGLYDFKDVPPGVYEVTVSFPNFATLFAENVGIAANNITRMDAPLQLGNLTERITVGADTVRLQSDKSDLHTDFTTRELTQLPIGGYRNFQSLTDLVPGTTPAQFASSPTDSPQRSVTTNINGTARSANNTRIDGAASVFTWQPAQTVYIPPLESIETVNIATNNFDAEQGMSGGAAVSVITKSGTNQFHGVAFEYHLNHKWGAKNLFFNPNTVAGPGTPQRIDNQYGSTLGGPIRRDKLFFFASWEATTTAERGNGLNSVPTAQARSGNFAGLATVYDPRTGDADGIGRTPFPNSRIEDSAWSPASRTIQSWIPLPNTGTGQINNYFASVPFYFKRDQVDGKLNWTPSSRINAFVKYSVLIAPVTAEPALGQAIGAYPSNAAGPGTGYTHTDVFGAGVSYVVGNNLLVDANFGGSRLYHRTTGPDYGTNIGSEVLRIPGTNGPDPRQSGFPIFNISGYTSLGNATTWIPVERNDRVYTYTANLSWTKSAHNLRLGFDFVKHQINHWQPEAGGFSPRGGFNFVNSVTALNLNPDSSSTNNLNAYAAFLLGLPGSFGKAYQFYDPMSTRELQQGYYVRDNWQVTRKLSINIGLRFEHYPIANRGEFGIERYDPVTNQVILGGRGNNSRGAGTEAIPIQFVPRAGLACRLGEGTVIRAGFGITNDPHPLSRAMRNAYPAVVTTDFQSLNTFAFAGSLATGIPPVSFPALSSGVIDIPNTSSTNSLQSGKFRRGYIESFNFTVQRNLGAGFVLQTGYVGTRSIRQTLYFDANPGLTPGAGAAGRPLYQRFGVNVGRNFFIPMATNRYDAWQSNLTRSFSAGLFMTASYTWSKTLGITGGQSEGSLRFYVPTQYSKNRAVVDFDRTHAFVTAATYELPFGKRKKWARSGAPAAVLGGWQLNPSLALYSGMPFIVSSDGGSLNAPQNTQVADQLTANIRKFGGVGPGNPFYDPAAFRPVTAVRFGNMGLNALRGPRLANMNFGLFRNFPVWEAMDLQFRAEALNATNTPALSNPNANANITGNFMCITSTIPGVIAPQRSIRFGLRLAF